MKEREELSLHREIVVAGSDVDCDPDGDNKIPNLALVISVTKTAWGPFTASFIGLANDLV